MTEKAKAEYCTNLIDAVKAAATYWRLLKKTTKGKRACLLSHASLKSMNTVLKAASHQTSGK